MKNVGMCTVCPVCSGLRHCEHIIAVYVDEVALKMITIVKAGILICFLFTWFICNNKRNVILIKHYV